MNLHPLEYETRQTLRSDRLVPPGGRVVIGVSGGSDSLALLLVLAALRRELALELTVAHADHGLRPAETPAETRRVAEVAAGLGTPFRHTTLPVRQFAKKNGLSLEMAGRELRYQWFRQIAEELGGALVAVAHHADDQAETILLRLLRGAGRAGLTGMTTVNGLGVVRPFLNFPKARLRDYLLDKQLEWSEDRSNSDPRYLRNRLRLELLPFLTERFNPAIRRTLRQTGEILGAEDELLGQLAEAFYRRIHLDGPAGEVRLDAARLLTGHRALRRRSVELALREMTVPARFRQVETILGLAGTAAGEVHLPTGLRVVKETGQLRFAYPAGRIGRRGRLAVSQPLPFALEIPGPGCWALGGGQGQLTVEILAGPPAPEELRADGADYLDLDRTPFPLLARPPQPGDRFHPLGAPGSRKVADFLCDRKIPPEQRMRQLVLESGGRIVALAGQRIAHSCRVTGNTTRVVKVSRGG